MTKIIIGLVGMLACGKGAVKQRLVEKYNAQDCRFSTILRDVLTRVDLPLSRDNLIKISTVLRQNFGEDLLAKAIAKDASILDSDIVVIDGMRRMSDIGHLINLPNFILVSVEAKPEIRYKRLVKRNENVGDGEMTFEKFLADHKRETEITIPEVMSHAKEIINNDGSVEDLNQQVDMIVAKYNK